MEFGARGHARLPPQNPIWGTTSKLYSNITDFSVLHNLITTSAASPHQRAQFASQAKQRLP